MWVCGAVAAKRCPQCGAVAGGVVVGGCATRSGAIGDLHLCAGIATGRAGAREREADSVPFAAGSGNPCDLRRENTGNRKVLAYNAVSCIPEIDAESGGQDRIRRV